MFNTIPQISTDPGELDRLDARVGEAAQALDRKITKYQDNVVQAAARFRREADDRAARASVGEERAVVRRVADRDAERQVSEFHASIVTSTEGEREELITALAKQERALLALADLFVSPVQMLGRTALGEERRTQIQLQLHGAGPVELQTAAREAVARRDVVAGAAILTVVSRMQRKDKPFNETAFAEALMAEQFKAARQKIDGALEKIKAARDLNLAFQRGRTDPTSRIERGLASRRLTR